MSKKKSFLYVVAALLLAVTLDVILWYSSEASYVREKTITMNAEDTLCSGCNIEDGVYYPRGSYGQLNFPADIPGAETMLIRFNRPIDTDMSMRAYYAVGMDTISRDQSVEYTFPKGRTYAFFRFPKGDWTDYRFDFYGTLSIKDVTVSTETVRLHYMPDFLRIFGFLALEMVLLAIWFYIPMVRKGINAISLHVINPETRWVWIDYLYMVFAMVMLLHIIYVSVRYFSVQIGVERFHIPILIFSVISLILGRTWKNKGTWILLSLLMFSFLRLFLFEYDSMEISRPFLEMGLYAYAGCYSVAGAIKRKYLKHFLLLFCALWTLCITVLSGVGIYVAKTGENFGLYKTLTLMYGRLYLIRHPVVSGILESVSLAVCLLGFQTCQKKAGRILFLIPVPVILLAGILTSTRTNYILTATVFSILICTYLYDRMNPAIRGGRYRLPAWKWAVLGVTALGITAVLALLQPYAIDGFNAIQVRGGILIRQAFAEGTQMVVPKIENRNFSNAGAISLTGRLDIWQSLFKAVQKEPRILLYGQSLDYNMEKVNVFLREAAHFSAYHCHNTVFQTLLEDGLPAALLYLSFQLYFLYHAYSLITNKSLPFWQRFVPIPAVACAIGGLVDITTHFRSGNPQLVILYLFAGITIALSREIVISDKARKQASKESQAN